MTKKKCLFIHIGSHKTGSTSLQHFLYNQQEHLNKNDFTYFSKNALGFNERDKCSNSWIKINKKNLLNENGVEIKKMQLLCKKLFSSNHQNVILSSENFSWIFHKKPLRSLSIELKKYFYKIKIIIYLRRQDEMAVSFLQECSKKPNLPESRIFEFTSRAIPKINTSQYFYFNYYEKLSLWRNTFGKENLIIRCYDKKKLNGGEVITDFLNALNIPPIFSEKELLNKSNGFEATKVGHLLNESIKDKKLNKYIRKYLSHNGNFLPSKKEAKNYLHYYKDSNHKLYQEYKIKFNNNFSRYPEKGNDKWTNESANRAIMNILQAINHYNDNSYLAKPIWNFIRNIKNLFKVNP